MSDYHFKLGMYLPELRLPFEEGLTKAKELGAEYIWYSSRLSIEAEMSEMQDGEIQKVGDLASKYDLEIFAVSPSNCFKQVHLAELEAGKMMQHPQFRRDFDNTVRALQMAKHLGTAAVSIFSFAWPGEYSAGKPTWPMRWVTRGGLISEQDMDKLVEAFSIIAAEAERHEVDIALGMMPWNFSNTTGNFRRIVEAVSSKRLKVMWGPADNVNCGEADAATAGFANVRPYLHGLHLKDLRVNDGLRLDFDYCPLGEGDVDFPTVLRNLRDHRCDVVLSVATHFTPASGSAEEAMRINFANLKELIAQVEAEA